MAMSIEKAGISLSAIYRPLNNIFLNKIMETIRKKYICKYQIKKGIGGLKNLIKLKNENFSTSLMIDQRVSEGILSNFFGIKASTTSIPGQLIKKFNIPYTTLKLFLILLRQFQWRRVVCHFQNSFLKLKDQKKYL